MAGRAPSLMILGTASGVGKSALCAALCRLLHRKGVSVAPFKAVNISLNSGVTAEGGEIARAQSFQALAAGIAPHSDMNPILLKPEGRGRMHLLLGGLPGGTLTSGEFYARRERFAEAVRAAFERLASRHRVVVMEGAGGAAEINLYDRDLANFWAAEMADAEVVLVGSAERGGVFASLYGTWALWPPDWRRRVRGFVINHLHGEAGLLGEGPEALRRRTGVPVLGILPYAEGLRLESEDGLELARFPSAFPPDDGAPLRAAVLRLPHIANFTDIEPFQEEPGLSLALVEAPAELSRADVVLLPGSKCTAADLRWLHERGFGKALIPFAEGGGIIAALCGGFQMLGRWVRDPHGVESPHAEVPGLGLLDMETVLGKNKTLLQSRARVRLPFFEGEVEGYEIHAGESRLADGSAAPAFERRGADGCIGAAAWGGRVWGTYLHGLFENDGFRASFLAWAREVHGKSAAPRNEVPSYGERRLRRLDEWAALVERHLRLSDLLGGIFRAGKREAQKTATY